MNNFFSDFLEKVIHFWVPKGNFSMKLDEIAHILGFESEKDIQVTGYQVDSRKIQPKNLFFALPGEKQDGHAFLKEAASKNAVGAVVKKNYSGKNFGLKLLFVDDVLKTLQKLAQNYLATLKVPLIAITGTVGKTTTKEFTATLLQGKYRVGKSPANYNTQIGLPLSILNLKGDEEVLVLEMGTDQIGQIKKLIEIAPPDISVLTKVTLVHAENFEDGIEGIARAKSEIFVCPKTKLAILGEKLLKISEINEKVSKIPRIKTFSLENREADYFLSQSEKSFFLDENGVRSIEKFELPFSETHFLEDFLTALAIAREMKLRWEEILPQLPKLSPPKMRFEKIEKDGVLFINDTYNANPEAMKMALENFPKPQLGGKKIAVFGSMRPLGKFAEESHTCVAEKAKSVVDHLLCIGEECLSMVKVFEEAKKPVEFFKSHKSLVKRLNEIVASGDVVLVKGSRDMQMEKVFELF